jgi:hypothetical protein
MSDVAITTALFGLTQALRDLTQAIRDTKYHGGGGAASIARDDAEPRKATKKAVGAVVAATGKPPVPAATKRTHWATDERRAEMRRAYPADEPMDVIMATLAGMDGPPIPVKATVQCFITDRLKLRRTNPKALMSAKAKAWHANRQRPPQVAVEPEQRATPGVALPPVSRSWDEIKELALRTGRELHGFHDLPAFNRARIARGEAPLAIRQRKAAA